MLARLLVITTALLNLVSARPTKSELQPRQDVWPFAPFKTSGRDIIDTRGQKVVYAGINWPGAADVMIPEGLQYQSISTIVSKIKDLGMNVIRLTYAIEMIDDIFNSTADSTVSGALTKALGSENATIVLSQILTNNPDLSAETTRLEVFDAIAAECAKQEIYVHLDNHMSKGEWCCSTSDGNSWFGDTFFNTTRWIRGLTYMSTHAFSWPAFVSTALRNELRQPDSPSPVRENYGWKDWYPNMVAAADSINEANSDPLIFFSGLGFDTDLANVTAGLDLGDGQIFNISNFTYADKIVLELHNYNTGYSGSCESFSMYEQGYNAMDTSEGSTARNIAPVVLTEFGYEQNSTNFKKPYPDCIKEYLTSLPGGPGGWMQWVLAGSYYIREGIQDHDETWGLFNHNWTDWRSEEAVEQFTKAFVEETLGVD
ncbi:Glycosyl hydrolase 5 family protein [Pseudocercospora fuligena]|uniref:Glycosyl hydrolase 5 family protein n=1 Tax=Pseudocercospora fuligena TaxID=685502 RepID=A0A8H6VTQ2_9PEZI|nr:Glycosyl hydrolase 5 family protein [Pseudocercospora fuligena]